MPNRLLELRQDLLKRTSITAEEQASGILPTPSPTADELLEKYGIPLMEIFYDHTREYGTGRGMEFQLTNIRYCKFLDLPPEQLAIPHDCLFPTGEPAFLRQELQNIFQVLDYEPQES